MPNGSENILDWTSCEKNLDSFIQKKVLFQIIEEAQEGYSLLKLWQRTKIIIKNPNKPV